MARGGLAHAGEHGVDEPRGRLAAAPRRAAAARRGDQRLSEKVRQTVSECCSPARRMASMLYRRLWKESSALRICSRRNSAPGMDSDSHLRYSPREKISAA